MNHAQTAGMTRTMGGMFAALTLFGLSTILPKGAWAQNCQTGQEGSATLDSRIQSGTYIISNCFFGMHINSLTDPWPTSYFANQRLEGSDVNWWNLEVAPGIYDYSYLDQWIALAQQHNVTLTYTFAGVPQFYSSVPDDTTCAFNTGACHPPKDLNEDGTGTDASFQNFVTDLALHNAEMGTPIQYWEMWNEPDQDKLWIPSCVVLNNCQPLLHFSQLVRMAADASAILKTINPNAVMLTPAPVGYLDGATVWMGGYLSAGGGQYADVISFHGYVNRWIMGNFPFAENEDKFIHQMKGVVKKYDQQTKPLWISEGGWGNVLLDGFNDPVLQSAFLARYLVLQQSLGISRGYWYQWDQPGGAGTLWQGPAPVAGNLRLPGYAYNSIVNWTMGATLTSACSNHKDSSIWVCRYARSTPAGYQAMIVWDAKETSTFTLPQQFEQYCDLKGNANVVQGDKVPIGIWPILLENENLSQSACQP